MSLVPEWRFCRKCGRMYDWNPDVGVIVCPYCKDKMKPLKLLWEIKKMRKK